MLFDESEALSEAALLSTDQAIQARDAADKLHASEAETVEGLRVETDAALKAMRDWQVRLRPEPPDVDVVLMKLATNPKSSLAEVGQLYSHHDGQQLALRKIIALKERSLVTARAKLEAGELSLLRTNLARLKAAAVLVATEHLRVEKQVHEIDPTVVVNVGDKLTSAIDQIVELQQLIFKKETGGF